MMNSLAMFGLATCLLICGWLKSDLNIVSVLTDAGFFSGFSQAGYANNHIDLSAQYTGVLMGISNSCSSVPGILGPQVSICLLEEETDFVGAVNRNKYLSSCVRRSDCERLDPFSARALD